MLNWDHKFVHLLAFVSTSLKVACNINNNVKAVDLQTENDVNNGTTFDSLAHTEIGSHEI